MPYQISLRAKPREIHRASSKTSPAFARLITLFAVRSMVIFALLCAPWPRWTNVYGSCFRSVGNRVFHHENAKAVIHFSPQGGTQIHRFDTEIVLSNSTQRRAEGTFPARVIQLESRAIGWIPTALTIALVLGTPGALRRRLVAAIVALIMVNAFLVFTLSIWILHEANRATELNLVHLGRLTETLVFGFHETLVIHFGAGLLAAVFIWALTSSRQFAETARLLPEE